ncbi:TPA: hypothetical protein N0F65_001965 [Lagenidium giganteum]|uniref:Ethylmalonyl-CoA decarboxylase n=1 Tax=Lagenidium giganteum TaxID=4803 RepID=A0AAV2YNC3_9STRA|nr:TPA: hypothetical protein N0F65_001965 [Lagenidium giganteum]
MTTTSSTSASTRYTHLVQKDITQPMDAMRHFNAKVEDGNIPIVLIPRYPMLFHFFLQIPSGVWVLKQKWNAHTGMMDPGLKLFWPAWNRISHIVTKQAVTYSNPVKFCPTLDNVMVDIDISISFQIGPTEEDAVRFVYSLGAHRFDELLYSLTEEAIRGLVHSVRHDQVHDLREDFALGMKKDLNHKLSEYGVFIHNVKVTNVDLPKFLSNTLEETTAFKTKMEEQEKNHENRLRILLNEETQKLTALQKENDRAIQDLLAVKARAIIHRDEMRTTAEAKAQVTIAEHMSACDNRIKEAEGYKQDAVATATAQAVKRKAMPLVELSNLQKDFEQYVNVAKIKRDAVVKAAEREAAKIQANADAEANSAANLVEKRNYDYMKKKLELETKLAATVPMVISGKNGDDLIRQTPIKRTMRRHGRVLSRHTCQRQLSTHTKHHTHGHDHRSSLLFDFVHHAQSHEDLVVKSRETLRYLGREHDHVRLRLPAQSPSTSHALPRTAFIELDNVAARNALSGKMMAELADMVRQLEDPEVHGALNAVVLRGTGGWFCAGADLQVAKKELSSQDAGTAMGALMVDTLTRFRRLPLVSVAVIEGGAFGGGAELATACDFRLIENSAVIQFVQSRMGVSPGWGGGARLLKLVGRQHALRLLCTADKLTAAKAEGLGLVDGVFDKDQVTAETAITEFLSPFNKVTPEVLHGAKLVITNADDVSLDEVLDVERQIFRSLWGGPANLRALESALSKANRSKER